MQHIDDISSYEIKYKQRQKGKIQALGYSKLGRESDREGSHLKKSWAGGKHDVLEAKQVKKMCHGLTVSNIIENALKMKTKKWPSESTGAGRSLATFTGVFK